MFGRILALIVLVAVVETVVFLQVAAQLGYLMTLWLLVVSAVVGIAMVKRQGLKVLRDAQGGTTPGAMMRGAAPGGMRPEDILNGRVRPDDLLNRGMGPESILQGMAPGASPPAAIGEGLMLLVSGILILTPGFVTDVVGLLLLLPPLRRAATRRFGRFLESRVRSMGGAGRPVIIDMQEGEYREGETTVLEPRRGDTPSSGKVIDLKNESGPWGL